MSIPQELKDEAFSEGLVAITEAGIKFDPKRNVPLANWLGLNIRWSLAKWKSSLIMDIPLSALERVGGTDEEAFMPSIELREVLALMDELLNFQERQVVLGTSLGFMGTELAVVLGISPVEVTRTKIVAQARLKEEFMARKVS